jgi:hypothetical protein
MTEGLGTCPRCGAPRMTPEQSVCGNCGGPLPALGGAAGLPQGGVSTPGGALPVTPVAPVQAGPAPVVPAAPAVPAAPIPAVKAPKAVVPIVRRPVLGSWSDFRAMLGIVLLPVAAWLFMAVLVGLTFGHAVSANLGKEFSSQALGDFNLDTIDVLAAWVGSVAMFASLTAGLGFQILGTDSSGLPSSMTFAIAPLGSLAVIALVTRFSTRRVFRRRPPFNVVDLFVRVTVIAVIGSAIVYAISALAILVVANSGNPPAIPPTGTLGGALPRIVTGASPVPSSLLFVLFPTFWIGAFAGVMSLAPARAFVGVPLMRFINGRVSDIWNWLTPVGVALRAYVITVFLSSIVFVIGTVVWLIAASPAATDADHPDAGAVLMAVPTMLVAGVNALFTLAIGFTGTMMDFGNSTTAHRYALWQSDGWAIVAGFLALFVPAMVTGIWVRARKRNTNPAQLVVASAAMWLVAVAGALLAGPVVTVTTSASNTLAELTSGTGLNLSPVTTTQLTPDLIPAAIVGGTLIVMAMLVGFGLGSLFGRPAQVQVPAGAPVPFAPAAPAQPLQPPTV